MKGKLIKGSKLHLFLVDEENIGTDFGWVIADEIGYDIFRLSIQNCKDCLSDDIQCDVQIVMDKIPDDLAPGGWDVFPKLDKEGCLILRRVV
jgi:hypothetical protein